MALFEFRLEDNLWQLHQELTTQTYQHGSYEDFYVADPKRRHIHKASVRDRVLHQAVFRVLSPIFDPHFIYDSYSSRVSKGTHAAVRRLEQACRRVSKNWKVPAYALKCDIRRFFDSIDHKVLRMLIEQRITDQATLRLIDIIFSSFEKEKGKVCLQRFGRGLPLGNVTSQLFANIYLDELDQFAKHILKARYYFRYCDDFILVHTERTFLEESLIKIRSFVFEKLCLELHPHKVEIRKVRQGIDFLGYIILPHRKVLRTTTRKRLLRRLCEARENFRKGKITEETFRSMLNSYLGVLSHARNKKVRRWVWKLHELIEKKGLYKVERRELAIPLKKW